jgi:hypothetical protein
VPVEDAQEDNEGGEVDNKGDDFEGGDSEE